MDLVICKNKLTYNFFKDFNVKSKYTKFTSINNYLNIPKDYNLVGHFAGTSPYKGTLELLQNWIKNKGYLDINPNINLIIVKKISKWSLLDRDLEDFLKTLKFTKTNKFYKDGLKHMNIYLYEYLPQDIYDTITNQSYFHICPSIMEGYGHYINEARIKKSIVITTDAEPMNELITDKKRLIEYGETKKIYDVIDNKYLYKSDLDAYFVKDDLTDKIKYVLSLDRKNIDSIVKKQFTDYENDTKFFIEKFSNIIEKLYISNKNITNIFNRIYEKKLWSIKDDPLSGEGSSLTATKETVKILDGVIKKYNIKSMYDSACGDMTWMPIVLKNNPGLKYIGGDVSEYIININKKREDLKEYEFRVIDFTKDNISNIPNVDLILCRDVLQHLDIKRVMNGLNNFSNSGSKFLLATNYLKTTKENSGKKIMTGYTNLRNLYHPPINLEEALECYDEKFDNKYLCLWKLPLRNILKGGQSEINLEDFEKKVYSQNGEDGILEKIFEVIGTTNKYYVEFGVEDGSERNTKYLMEEFEWEGLLMDGGYENNSINLKQEFITAENIVSLFEKYNVPKKVDLLSTDIDYNDLYVLNEILKNGYEPRVIVSEYNAGLGLEDKTVVYDPSYMWDRTNYMGASLLSFFKLLQNYGYSVVYCNKNGVNLFAIKNNVLNLIESNTFIDTNNLEKIYRKVRYSVGTSNKLGHKNDYNNRKYIDEENGLKYIDLNLKLILIIDDILSNQKLLNIIYNLRNIDFTNSTDYNFIDSAKKQLVNFIKEIVLENCPTLYCGENIDPEILDIIIGTLIINRLIVLLKKEKFNLKKETNRYEIGDNYTKYPYSDKYIFYVAKNDKVLQDTLKRGYLFEIYNTMILNSFLKKTDTVLDIGANIGTMSVPLSRIVSEGTVHSFEPFEKTFQILSENVKVNNCKNIKLYNNAVGNENMITFLSDDIIDFSYNLPIEVLENENKRPMVKIKNRFTAQEAVDLELKLSNKINYGSIQLGKGGQLTKMITVDSLKLPSVDVIKVDVEGAEPLVFYGARETIKKYKPIILFEYNWQKVTSNMIKTLNLQENVIKFNIMKYCKTLGYNIIIESDRDDFILIHPSRQLQLKDKMVHFEKVDKLNISDTDGYTLFKFIKPKWE